MNLDKGGSLSCPSNKRWTHVKDISLQCFWNEKLQIYTCMLHNEKNNAVKTPFKCRDCPLSVVSHLMTPLTKQYIWVRTRNCGCLVTWFCYQLIAKPGNKTAAVSWPDRYTKFKDASPAWPISPLEYCNYNIRYHRLKWRHMSCVRSHRLIYHPYIKGTEVDVKSTSIRGILISGRLVTWQHTAFPSHKLRPKPR